MTNYKDKYLKYKNKYLDLKQQYGSACNNCPILGFHQYSKGQFVGTCSNDTFLTLLLYSDDLSENIQNIFNAILRFYNVPDPNSNLLDFKQEEQEEQDVQLEYFSNMSYEEFKQKYEKLINEDKHTKNILNIDLDIEQNKFFLPLNIDDKNYNYFYNESLQYIYNTFFRYYNDMKKLYNPIEKLKRQISFQQNEACMNNLLNICNINSTIRISTPSNIVSNYITSNIFNYFLMNCKKKFLNFKIIDLDNNTDIKNILELKQMLIKCSNIGMILKSLDKEKISGHLNGFIKCKNVEYFYDDNGLDDDKDKNTRRTIIEFEWKKKLLSICDDIIINNIIDNQSKIFTSELFSIDILKLKRYQKKIHSFIFVYVDEFINGPNDNIYLSNYITDNIINNLYLMTDYNSDNIYQIYNFLLEQTKNNTINLPRNYWIINREYLINSQNIRILKLLLDNKYISLNKFIIAYLKTNYVVKEELDKFIKEYSDKTFDINNILYYAIDSCMDGKINTSIIDYLLKNGADINYKNLDDETPLIYTIRCCYNDLSVNEKTRIKEIIYFFIDNNADLHSIDKSGKTAFMISIDPDDNINNSEIAYKIYEKDNSTFTNYKDQICSNKQKYKPLIRTFILNKLCR
jgi:hypothetical protein